MNYRTLADMTRIIRWNLHRIPRLPVVGIPRSGMIAASIIATLKNVPLHTYNELLALNCAPERVLLVDDSVSGGETMNKVRRVFIDARLVHVTCAVYVKPQSPKPDIWFEELPGPRVFEWNWAKHTATKYAVFDIDGVLCDETEKIRDWSDKQHVLQVRESAKLLHWPAREVLAIATGRKEDEREVTEEWLAAHNVRYKHIFFSTPDRGARQTKLHAIREIGARWMVESNLQQAYWLRREAGIPVLCTDSNQML